MYACQVNAQALGHRARGRGRAQSASGSCIGSRSARMTVRIPMSCYCGLNEFLITGGHVADDRP